MSHPLNTSTNHTSKKVKAFLAGGLVLGVGVVVTLAAWTDQEWASSSFQAGTFEVQSSTDGATFENHPADGPASLKFETDVTENLSPGDKVAAAFLLRVTEDTTYSGTGTLTNAELPEGQTRGLTYGIVEVNSFEECTTATTGIQTIAPDNTPLGQVPDEIAPFNLPESGEEAVLCIQVSANDQLEQQQSAQAAWVFDIVSNDQ